MRLVFSNPKASPENISGDENMPRARFESTFAKFMGFSDGLFLNRIISGHRRRFFIAEALVSGSHFWIEAYSVSISRL